MSSLKFNFVASCEEIQGHFPAKAPDHSYENVCQVIRKTVINYLEKTEVLNEKNWQRRTKQNKRKITEATPSILYRTATICFLIQLKFFILNITYLFGKLSTYEN